MRRILTVHGINTDGKWQEDVKFVLEPHFQCKAVRYPHYRRFGALKLILEPWVLALAVGSVLLGWWLRYLSYPLLWLLGAVVVSIASSFVRRDRAHKCYFDQVKGWEYEKAPHLIAHSMGTYLSARTIRKHAWFKLSHIVFAGCIVSKRFRWRPVLGFPSINNPTTAGELPCLTCTAAETAQVVKVRNDVQLLDWVAVAASALRALLFPDFGWAGHSGFKETVPCPPNSPIIHEVPRPDAWCPSCKKNEHNAPIHNVFCAEYSHSDVFMSPDYIAYFWLPFFWDIEPPEYSLFLEWCLEAAQGQQDGDWLLVSETEGKLRNREWIWSGCTLSQFVRRQVSVHLRVHPGRNGKSIDDLVDLAVEGTWKAFNLAKEAYRDRNTGWENRVRALHPRIAVTKAVAALFQT